MHFALAELLKKGDKFIPKNVIEKKGKKSDKKSLDLVGEFDENDPPNIILKVSDKKKKALEDLGISSPP